MLSYAKFTLYPYFLLKGPTDIRSTLEYLMTLFPRKLFNDTLPQIVIKHQLYSIHNDKTLVDKEVVRRLFMCQKGCMFVCLNEVKIQPTAVLLVHRINCGNKENCWCSSLGLMQKLSGWFSLQTTRPKCWQERRAEGQKQQWRSSWRKCCLLAQNWASAKTRCSRSSSSPTLR